MSKTQFKSKKKRISTKRLLGTLAVLILAFLMLNSVINVSKKYFTIRRHISDLSEEKDDLETKYNSLVETNEYLRTPEGTEQVLREKYNVTRPGEGVIIVLEPDTPAEPDDTIISKWWNNIMNIFRKEHKSRP